jgi:hypothetical protein
MPGEDSIPTRMKLWVTGAYSDGFPNVGDVILSGPAPVVIGDDDVHPTKIQYVFDPPLGLPEPGQYAFYIQPECAFLYFDLLAVNTGDYLGGRAVSTIRPRNCELPPASYFSPQYDLLFNIEFCPSTVTPIQRRSWGGVKLIYR